MIRKFFIAKFGMQGSWQWALKQMQQGSYVKRSSQLLGHFKMLNDGSGLIYEYRYDTRHYLTEYVNASPTFYDYIATDWVIVKGS